MFKRISTMALFFSTFALIAGCEGQGANQANNGAPDGPGASDVPEAETTSEVAAAAVRAPAPQPIQAVFTQQNFTTVYTATVANPDRDQLVFTWSGAHCGVPIPETLTCDAASCTSKLTWNHASPPCPAHSHHEDTTIVFQAIGTRSGRTVVCTYKGADSGTGPTCYQNGFAGTELGTQQPNSAFIRYHVPIGKQCSKVDLIQVLSVVEKRSGRVVRPHNAGMDESEPNMLGYQVPLAEDDVDGFVVDKFHYRDISTNDPYYAGSVSGSATKDAELDDRPGNTRDGHRARFEVCAFCSGNPGDAEYGKYLDCFTWEHDGDTGEVRKSDPQPTQTPTPEFEAAVSKWNQNKGFTMPNK